MPTLRGIEYKTAGTHTFTVPAGVSSVFVTMIGGGGGGGPADDGYIGSGAGGYCGESCCFHPVKVTPLADITVTIGAGGTGGVYADPDYKGDDGGDSSFGTYFTCQAGTGGHSSQQPSPTVNPIKGGGVGGGNIGTTPNGSEAATGLIESPTFWGGNTGGGVASGVPPVAGTQLEGRACGPWLGGEYGLGIVHEPGSGGGATIYGEGGPGGNSLAEPATAGFNAPADAYGAGGGGSGTKLDAGGIGGTGADGYCLVQWVE